jgi:hypothetical protein
LDNGEIPIVELAKLAKFSFEIFEILKEDNTIILQTIDEKFIERTCKNHIIKIVEGFEVDTDEFGFDLFSEITTTGKKTKTSFKPVPNILKIIQYLYENCFDVNGLISRGLALDINNVILSKINNSTDIVNLKDNIFIQGFDNYESMTSKMLSLNNNALVIIAGVRAQITEETANNLVEYSVERCKYKNYNPDEYKPVGEKMFGFNTSLFSIESACNKEYCLIWKTGKLNGK